MAYLIIAFLNLRSICCFKSGYQPNMQKKNATASRSGATKNDRSETVTNAANARRSPHSDTIMIRSAPAMAGTTIVANGMIDRSMKTTARADITAATVSFFVMITAYHDTANLSTPAFSLCHFISSKIYDSCTSSIS